MVARHETLAHMMQMLTRSGLDQLGEPFSFLAGLLHVGIRADQALSSAEARTLLRLLRTWEPIAPPRMGTFTQFTLRVEHDMLK